MGGYSSNSVTAGATELNLRNCTVGTIYGGGYGENAKTLGPSYINVYENVNITGSIYPKGVGKRPDGVNSGPVTIWAYVTLNDEDQMSSQLKKIKYTKAQAPFIFVNGAPLGEQPEITTASFETAVKSVEVTAPEASDTRGNRSIVFLNGIPTVVAGDGNGHTYLYQAKMKDGTLNVYQKNADGTFKYENGKRVSNIVRDPKTGQAIKGPKLINSDVSDSIVYGGANGKSVEDVYFEFHNGGMYSFYAGCRGGDAGAGIGGGAAPGGAGPAGPAGPSVDDGGAGDDGETTDPVTPTPDDNRRFIDVAETDWFNKAVNYVADNNYFQGVSENEFDSDGKMTRAMLVTVIGRMAKADTSGAVNNFTDVEDGSWYAGYVAWAAENGIINGAEGNINPKGNATRAEVAQMIMNFCNTFSI